MANGATLGTGYVQIVPSAQGIKGSIENVFGDESVSAGKNLGSRMGGAIKAAILTAGIGAAISKSLSLGGALQQSIGGVETLFGEAADKVIANADRAFQTAGVSANAYMEQVTSFSATLLQGLEGDTEAAVKYADMAIIDMSDNANKMGTDVAMIQNAYQGFAKDNYTMLDNLKLGYGGTATEMARLINDSGVLGENVTVTAQTVKDVPFDKIIEAIHNIQEDLGIAGTTSVEAAETFTGSMGSMKAALENVFANAALGRDMQPALEGLAKSMKSFFLDNLFPMIQNLLKALPEMLDVLSTVLGPMMPEIINGVVQILTSAITMLIQFIPEFISAAINMAGAIIDALCRVDWGSVAIRALDAIKQSFERHPIATTIALSLLGFKLAGQSVSTIASMAMAKIKSLLVGPSGLTPLGKGLSTAIQLAIGFALAYKGISDYTKALDTDGIMDDILSAVTGAFGGALIGAKIGGPMGAAIGASIVCAIELIITIFHRDDKQAEEISNAFQLVRDEWIKTGKISQDQAALLDAAFASQSRAIRDKAWWVYDQLQYVTNVSGDTMEQYSGMFEDLARDMGVTVEGAAKNTTGVVNQTAKTIYGSFSGTKKSLDTTTKQISTNTQNNFKSMSSGVNTTLSGLQRASVDSASRMMSGFNNTIRNNTGTTGTLARNIKNNFMTPVNELPGATSTAMTNTLGKVSGSQSNAIAYSLALGKAVASNFQSATNQMSVNMQATMSRTMNMISGQTASAQAAGLNIGKSIANGVSAGVRTIPGQISAIMNSVTSTTRGYINQLAAMFKGTSFRFNSYIPLPHFYMNGSFNAKARTVPSVGVRWYEKAAEYGALFDSPQIIGVGDAAQPELLIGEDKLREMLGTGQVTINVYPQKGQSEEAIASAVMRKMQLEVNKRRAAMA